MNKIVKAYHLAKTFHEGQLRRYSKEPYFVHCVDVFHTLLSVTKDIDMLCAGLLHDTLEDTECTIDIIKDIFNERIAYLVDGMTDKATEKHGDRAKRKELDRDRIAEYDEDVHTIKLADMISNMPGIIKNDPVFAITYLNEKKMLLKVLDKGNEVLYNKAKKIVDDYYKFN